MGEPLADPQDQLTAIAQAAQYLAMLRADADLWPELGRVVTRFFGADLVVFFERRDGHQVVTLHASVPDEVENVTPLVQQAAGTVRQVIASGFMATDRLALDDGYAVAVLPLSWDGRTTTAMLVGHRTSGPLSASALNVYLGLAGLLENTTGRLVEQRRAEKQSRAALQYARSLLEASLDPLVTISAKGKITDVNGATEQVTGVSREKLIGTDFSDYFTEPERAREAYRRAFGEGLVRDYPLAIRHASGSVTEVLYNVNVFRDEAARVVGVFAAARDVTERKRVEEALRESESRFRTVADLTYSWEAWIGPDLRFIYISPACERITGYRPEEFESDPDLAVSIVHPEDRDSFVEHQRLHHGESREDVSETQFRIVRRDGEVRWIAHLCRPVFGEDGGFRGRRISNRDITDVYELEQQRFIAKTLQENFIHPLPDVAGMEMAVVSRAAVKPALVGGDFHSVFRASDGRTAILLGDVSGKGVKAAGLSETVRSAAHGLALIDASPAFILGKVNQLLLEHDSGGQFVTAILLMIDTRTGRLTYASAGHPAPLLIDATGGRLLDETVGLPLGTFECSYSESEATLAAGQTLVLYTDGLTEARSGGQLFGEEGLLNAVATAYGRSVTEIVEDLSGAAERYAGSLSDDMDILAVRLLPETTRGLVEESPLGSRDAWQDPVSPEDDAGHVLHLQLPLRRDAAGTVRLRLRSLLAAHQLPMGTAEAIVLATEEACINAIMHSGDTDGGMRVSAEVRGPDVVVEVSDGGCGFDVPFFDSRSVPDPLLAHGRGLFLIHCLMDEVRVESDAVRGCTRIRMLKRA